uniref:Uncharacterized protein n=1 Tax=Klebsiella pneumoniae TaxID=573 RepID=A0A8B0SU75_KLEPN|nr:hypothetical protein [Klebsiella pneumoniae]
MWDKRNIAYHRTVPGDGSPVDTVKKRSLKYQLSHPDPGYLNHGRNGWKNNG